MGELKETETVESKTMKKRKNLKESNVFKLLIYGLFLISCAAGFISGYFVIAEYYIGAYEENGTATAAAFESVVSNVTETEVYS